MDPKLINAASEAAQSDNPIVLVLLGAFITLWILKSGFEMFRNRKETTSKPASNIQDDIQKVADAQDKIMKKLVIETDEGTRDVLRSIDKTMKRVEQALTRWSNQDIAGALMRTNQVMERVAEQVGRVSLDVQEVSANRNVDIKWREKASKQLEQIVEEVTRET